MRAHDRKGTFCVMYRLKGIGPTPHRYETAFGLQERLCGSNLHLAGSYRTIPARNFPTFGLLFPSFFFPSLFSFQVSLGGGGLARF